MSESQSDAELLAELAEQGPSSPAWARWLAEHPAQTAELADARRVHLLVAALREAEFELPPGFEARILARIQADIALRNLLDFGVSGVGSLLLELVALIFGLFPRTPAPAQS